jgi:hypothetical protein
MDETLTKREAFLAMYAFLERIYERLKSDDLGGILGDMSLLPDGGTADPSVWSDWELAVQSVKNGKTDARLKLRRGKRNEGE